jgi:hypothetical protein
MLRSNTRSAAVVSRLRPKLGPVGLLATGALVACGVLVPLERAARPVVDAGADAPSGALACGPIPDRPTSQPAMPSRDMIVYAAVTWAVHPDQGSDDFCPTGVNLDGLITEPDCTQTRACEPHPPSVLPEFRVTECDYANGADNALGALLEKVAQRIDQIVAEPKDLITKAYSNLLVTLVDYNGGADDEDVTVRFEGAIGLDTIGVIRDSFSVVPQLPVVWDGTQDVGWIVDQRSVITEGTIQRPAHVATGYVRDRVLVVPEVGPGLVPVVSMGASGVMHAGGVFTAFIDPLPDGRTRLVRARLGVRVASSAMLAALGPMRVNPNDKLERLCDQSSILYPGFRSAICGALDLPASGGRPDRSARCGMASLTAHATFVESRVARNPDGSRRIESRDLIGLPCVEEKTKWCDDCAWDRADRCPLAE